MCDSDSANIGVVSTTCACWWWEGCRVRLWAHCTVHLPVCVCPLGALPANLLTDPRQHQVDVETLSPPDLDEVARVIADAVHGVGSERAWGPWRGAGGEPAGVPADSSEAALLQDGDVGRDSVQGEPLRSWSSTLWWAGRDQATEQRGPGFPSWGAASLRDRAGPRGCS